MSSAVTQNTWMITARLPRDLAEQLRRVAEQRNQRVTEIVVRAISREMKESNQPAEQAA
jgi:predicted transcriptional regulator